jgi:hypothetical protein
MFNFEELDDTTRQYMRLMKKVCSTTCREAKCFLPANHGSCHSAQDT